MSIKGCQIGDKIVHKGLTGVVVDFYRFTIEIGYRRPRDGMPAGVYRAKGVPIVQWENYDKPVNGPDVHDYTFLDKEIGAQRAAEYNALGDTWSEREKAAAEYERLSDLPETPYLEGDIVRLIDGTEDDRHVYNYLLVTDVDYANEKNGQHWFAVSWANPFTKQTVNHGSTFRHGDRIELVSHGNMWRIAHGEKPLFSTVIQEINLAMEMETFSAVKTLSDDFEWTLDEAVQAIKEGRGDFFTTDRSGRVAVVCTSTS